MQKLTRADFPNYDRKNWLEGICDCCGQKLPMFDRNVHEIKGSLRHSPKSSYYFLRKNYHWHIVDADIQPYLCKVCFDRLVNGVTRIDYFVERSARKIAYFPMGGLIVKEMAK